MEAKQILLTAAIHFSGQSTPEIVFQAKGGIFNSLEESNARAMAISQSTAGTRQEVEAYLREKPLNHTEDPLKWWDEKRGLYPRLVKMVPRYLSMIRNSVPCERIFSFMGEVYADRRSCLSVEKASMIGCIGQNICHVPPCDLYA